MDVIDRQNKKRFKFKQGNWDNSDVQVWPKNHWEMAKVFMNPGQKKTQTTPKDTDLSGVLNFIDHCMIAKTAVVNKYNISEVGNGSVVPMIDYQSLLPLLTDARKNFHSQITGKFYF